MIRGDLAVFRALKKTPKILEHGSLGHVCSTGPHLSSKLEEAAVSERSTLESSTIDGRPRTRRVHSLWRSLLQ